MPCFGPFSDISGLIFHHAPREKSVVTQPALLTENESASR
jgi:hypothetical protein